MLGGLGRGLIFLIITLSWITSFAQSDEAQRNCQSFLSNRQLVVRDHQYINFNKKSDYENYDEFAQALTEGLTLSSSQFVYAEKYFREYFGLGIGANLDHSSKEFKKKIELATDQKKLTRTNWSEVSFRLKNKKHLANSGSLNGDERRRHNWAVESEYLRLRPLTPMEEPFTDHLRGFNSLYSRHFDKRFFDSVNEYYYYTLTNEKNQSLGEILVGVGQYTETIAYESNGREEVETSQPRAAFLHHISGVPVAALDQVLLGLYKIFSEERLTILIHQDFEDPRAHIDIPVDDVYDPPLMLEEDNIAVASNPDVPSIYEEYMPIEKVRVVDPSQRLHKTKIYRAVAHFNELLIHGQMFDRVYDANSYAEVLEATQDLFANCKNNSIGASACKKMIEATLHDSDLDLKSKFQFLKTYIEIHSLSYKKDYSEEAELALFNEYWPLIYAFNDNERATVISKLLNLHLDNPVSDSLVRHLSERLIYGIHIRFDLESIDFIFGHSEIIMSYEDKLPITPHPRGVDLEPSYAAKIRANDLDFMERLLQNGLEPTRGMVIAIAQKLIHPNFNLSLQMVELFESYGADVNFNINSVIYAKGARAWFRMAPGESFLSMAILLGRFDLVEFFVKHDSSLFENFEFVSPQAFHIRPKTLADYANSLGYYDIAEYLESQMVSDD